MCPCFLCLLFLPLSVVLLWFRKKLFNKDSLEGANVIITGGSQGIGRCLAIEAAKRGAKSIVVFARNIEHLHRVREEIIDIFSKGPAPETRRVSCLSVDVSNSAQVQEAVQKVLSENQELDVLINCAGFSIPKVLELQTDEEIRRLIEVNYLGSAYVTRALLPALKRRYPAGSARGGPMRNGHIVFVGSMAGQFPVYGYGAYAASKFAVRGFAEGVQMELAAHPIRVTLAHPADTDTPGYAVENKLKSELTMKLSNEGGVFTSEETARKILEDTLRGEFLSWIGMNGYLLARVTAGMAPARSLLDSLIDIFAAPLFRIIALFVVHDFYSKVRRWAPPAAQPATAAQSDAAASNSGGKKRD